jgi:aminoglycoside phosphotransferase family enzyme/predicted kinase
VIEAMLKPEFYPHPVSDVELKQTHTSYVLLAGDFAYKVRKAIRFPFIDCSTAARRSALCQRELELNRRLSSDIYLDVVAIKQSGGCIILDESKGDRSAAVDFAVKMRRLPENCRLDSLLKHELATIDIITEIGNTIADFHTRMPNSNSWDYGAAAKIWRMTIGNLSELEPLVNEEPLLLKIAQIEAYSRRYIAAHWELLNSRAREGRVHEGHGDLRADAVYLTAHGIRIIDCLEFDERLRYGDIANEIAFLAMDLDRLGRADLSQALVALFAHDQDIGLLTNFYKCYRATVRTKVELLRSQQPDCAVQEKQTACGNALFLLDLAVKYSEGPKVLLIVCGASGTGKSTLAANLSEHLGFDIVSSDIVRKRLAGIESTRAASAPYKHGIYTPDFTNRVYKSMVAEAKIELNNENGVILDATFSKRIHRQLAIEAAQKAGVKLLFIECRAPKDIIIRRLRQRQQDAERISDADVEIYLSQTRDFEALDEIPAASRRVVDTTQPHAAAVLEIERAVFAN